MSMRVLMLILLVSWSSQADFKHEDLRDDWTMTVINCPPSFKLLIGKEFKTSVPSTLHLILQKYKQIPNPFFGQNLRALSSISQCQIKYSKKIQITNQLSLFSKTVLAFEGIDTYGSVYINQQFLGKTQNAFLKYEYDVRKHLKQGSNQIVVKIRPTKPHDSQGQQRDRMPFDYSHTRKAAYQYSWDWAPFMNTLGIWLPVSLTHYDLAQLEYVWVRLITISPQEAVLSFVIALNGVNEDSELTDKNMSVKIWRKDIKQVRQFEIKSKYNGAKLAIKDPQLWWPNGIGSPHVYQFQVILTRGAEGQVLDKKRIVYGLKTVELHSQGQNFTISVNGHPVYCKGANYVPPDMMYPRLTNPDYTPGNTIQNLLEDAVKSNFNMLRLWGGGQYQSEEFFELASKKGIMIFHDFMFSDSIYPATDQFLDNVRKEIVYQVRRVRNYPALVLWSGNNEIYQGIVSWGWGQPKYRQNYKKLFSMLIPDILQAECNNIPYIESSPSRGVGNGNFGQGGDIHYWGVWAAGMPFQSYETALGGFNSQFGTQSLPVWQTILQFTLPSDRMYESNKMLFHEKHGSRFNTLKKYMQRYAQVSLSFELQAYNSGLVHAYAMEVALRAQRIAKPKSFGTLYWMLNDAWPSVSWSSIDYYGRWKAVQYQVKKMYKDIILFYHPHTGKFVAVNDKLVPIKANYIIQVMTFDGKVLFEEAGSLSLNVNQKRDLRSLDAAIVAGLQKQCVVYTEIVYGMMEDNRTILTTFFKPLKDLKLQPVQLTVHYLYGTNELLLSSEGLIKSLYISNTRHHLKFSDNYFDVIPKKTTKVTIVNPPADLQSLKTTFVFRSYRQVYDPVPLRIKFQN